MSLRFRLSRSTVLPCGSMVIHFVPCWTWTKPFCKFCASLNVVVREPADGYELGWDDRYSAGVDGAVEGGAAGGLDAEAALVEVAEDAIGDVGDEGCDGFEEAVLEVAGLRVFGGDDELAGEIDVAREAAESDADAAFADS